MLRVVILLLITLAACKRDEAPAQAREASAFRAPEAWTFGAGRDRILALPPPCTLRADMLRTVLARETRFVAERATLGMLLAAEVSRAPEERVDAAGSVRMLLGSAEFTAVPWPAQGSPRAARDGERWVLAWHASGGMHLWRGDKVEWVGKNLEPVDLHCAEGRCLVLASASQEAQLIGGALDESASTWRYLPLPSGRAQRIVSLDRVMLIANGELVVVNVADQARGEKMPAPYGVLDALVARELVAALPAGPPRCSAETGGVVVASRAFNQRLRSQLPAGRASLQAIAGGFLVLWLAPTDCESGQKTLFASVLRSDGTPVGPVTAVGAVTDYAVAARGAEVDLWVEHEGTLSWAPARCELGR